MGQGGKEFRQRRERRSEEIEHREGRKDGGCMQRNPREGDACKRGERDEGRSHGHEDNVSSFEPCLPAKRRLLCVPRTHHLFAIIRAIRTPSGSHQDAIMTPSVAIRGTHHLYAIGDHQRPYICHQCCHRNQVSISPLTCRSQSSSHTSSFTARLAANAASVPDEGRNHSPSAARL